MRNNTTNQNYVIKQYQEKAHQEHEKEKLCRGIWKEEYTEQNVDNNNETEEVRQFF